MPPDLAEAALTVVAGLGGEWGVARLPGQAPRPGGPTSQSRIASSSEAVYLRPFDHPMVAGAVLLEAQVTRPEVTRVDFWIDGKKISSAELRPFEAWLRLAPVPEPRLLAAVAYGANGEEVGRDEMHINQGMGGYGVRIRRPRRLARAGLQRVEVEVRAPPAIQPRFVDLFWNERRLVRLRRPPYEVYLELPSAVEGDYLAARASFADEATYEDALVHSGSSFAVETDVELIELYTVVKGAHQQPLADLGAEEFEIWEEGRQQQLHSFEYAADVPLRLALSIDISESMEARMPMVKAAAKEFIASLLKPRDQVMLVAFNHRPRLLRGPSGDASTLAQEIDQLPSVGGTALFDAVTFSLLHLRDLPGRKAVVLLTDGKDRHSRFSVNNALQFSRQSSVPVYLIALDAFREPLDAPQSLSLQRLATLTGGEMYAIDSERDLPAIYREIATQLRHQYVLSFQSDYDGESTNWRHIELRVKRPGALARTISGYFPRR